MAFAGFFSTEPKTVSTETSSKTVQKQVYQKLNVGEDQNKYVRYASKISNNDLDFLATLEAENGLWTLDRRSRSIGSNGSYDWGLCQINQGYHPEIVNDERFFVDPYWQLDQCWRLYSGGTKFYGADNRKLHYDKFYLTN